MVLKNNSIWTKDNKQNCYFWQNYDLDTNVIFIQETVNDYFLHIKAQILQEMDIRYLYSKTF